jgi:GT2 family glycosyltransferase
MNISVVVVTWNGLHLLQPCVAALETQTVPFELVVVDNGSVDGTADWIRHNAPYAKLIAVTDNLGFAAGNNVGIRQSTGDAVVLINNDTLPSPLFLESVTQPLGESADIGAVGGVLVFAHRPDLIASAGIVPGMDGVHLDRDATLPVSALPQQPVEIFGASGGAVCFRRAALDDVGLFDAGYGSYLEDADLAWRLRLRGWRTLLAPPAHILHVYSATSGHTSPLKQRLLARNRWRVLWRCWPTALLRRYAARIAAYDALAIAYGAYTRQFSIVQGRLQALRQARTLFHERHFIQRHTTVTSDDLAHWLVPPRAIHATMQDANRLGLILKYR